MNINKIKYYIDQYKLHFTEVHLQEIYKWKAVKCFQDNWNIDSRDFHIMLDKSLYKTKNLLDSGNYYAKGMILENPSVTPESVRSLFRDLYDEQEDLIERMRRFQNEFAIINSKNFPGKSDYQDLRAIIVYLALRFPDRYFLYKFTMFKNFAQKIDLDYIPIRGRFENIGYYQSMCEYLKYEIVNDQELLKFHKDRLTNDCYFDENYNILTQDLIYAVDEYLNSDVPIASTNIQVLYEETLEKFENTFHELSFKGRIVNYEQIDKENKRIGNLGENWVIQREREKLIKAGLRNKIVRQISVEEGDGTGFDIRSYDANGNEIFIEVKTTTGKCNQPIFISRNELERSKQDSEKYYLYRVFDFNEQDNSARLLILPGDLSQLCDFPSQFKARIFETHS
jgi:hypothetical protein